MNKSKLNSMVANNYDLIELEKNLVYYFIKNNKIDIKYSAFLENYFSGFNEDDNLQDEIEHLQMINDLEHLENHLELLIPEGDRKVNGAFFTPPYIVNKMIDIIAPQKDDKNIDISCGSGAFLIGLVRYYKEKFNKPINDIVKENIYGIDILEYNIRRSKIILSLYACMEKEKLDINSFNLKCKNSLESNINELFNCTFDNVLGNPPYVKYQDLSEELRGRLNEDWETTKKGSYNLYFPFFEIAYNIINEKGRVIYITPNNYFTTKAAKPLRKYFQNQKSIKKIIDFSHKLVFENVQTYTAITLLSKNENEIIKYSKIENNQEIIDFLNDLEFAKNPINKLKSRKWRLLKQKERKNINNIESIGTPLDEIVDIRVGIATQKDAVYFVDYIEETEDYYIKEDGTKIEKQITVPVVKITKINSQKDLQSNKKRIIFPYKIKKGKAELISEENLSTEYSNTYNYLLQHKDILLKRDGGKIPEEKWYKYGRRQGINRFGIKLLVPTHSENPRFLKDTNTESLFTNGYGLYYKDIKKAKLLKGFHLLSLEENIDVLQKVLNSVVMNYFVRKTSTALSGAKYCYQKNFIKSFTIPYFSEEELNKIRTMSKKELDEFLINAYRLKEVDL
ncbi:class I SAM-dependent DNA methyltransferase [Natroniella sp. ANB-PHB2]|uniref:HsdM family class I SAM-dependent methyltransferase n=1 Tax=Natroniella sp. ANB-PHB2 TaxID=3384444 RepID=UPI0038D365F2